MISEPKTVLLKRNDQIDSSNIITHDDYAYCIFTIERLEEEDNTTTNESNINYFKEEINRLTVQYERYEEYNDFTKEQGGNNLESESVEYSVLGKMFLLMCCCLPCYQGWRLTKGLFEENEFHLRWFVDLTKRKKTVTYRIYFKLFELIVFSFYLIFIVGICMLIPSLVIFSN